MFSISNISEFGPRGGGGRDFSIISEIQNIPNYLRGGVKPNWEFFPNFPFFFFSDASPYLNLSCIKLELGLGFDNHYWATSPIWDCFLFWFSVDYSRHSPNCQCNVWLSSLNLGQCQLLVFFVTGPLTVVTFNSYDSSLKRHQWLWRRPGCK